MKRKPCLDYMEWCDEETTAEEIILHSAGLLAGLGVVIILSVVKTAVTTTLGNL